MGSGTCRTIRETVENVCGDLEIGVDLRFGDLPYQPYEPMHLVADTAKLTQLGWAAVTPLSYAVWQLAKVQCPELRVRQPNSSL